MYKNKSKLIQRPYSICFHFNVLKKLQIFTFFPFFFLITNVIDGQTFLSARGLGGWHGCGGGGSGEVGSN